MVRKPDGVAETEDLLRKLVQVPKKELDREVQKHAARKHKKRATKRKRKS